MEYPNHSLNLFYYTHAFGTRTGYYIRVTYNSTNYEYVGLLTGSFILVPELYTGNSG